MNSTLQQLATDVVEMGLAAGATAVEVSADQSTHTELEVRNGAIENLQQAGSRGLSIRVWKGDHSASTYTTDTSPDAIRALLNDTLALAPYTDAVPEQALPNREWLATDFPDFDQYDHGMAELTPEQRLSRVREAEEAALSFDPRITTSGGASWFDAAGEHVLANSLGFVHRVLRTSAQMAVQVIADDADWKKRNGAWHSGACHLADLQDAASVGRSAAEKALHQLGAGPVPTRKIPGVFDPYMAGALLGTLIGCMRGSAVERRSSYLLDSMGKPIASPLLTVVDDPTLLRRSGSRACDSEGITSRRTPLIQEGVLQTWLLGTYSARKLGLLPTGHGSGESVASLLVQQGEHSVEDLIGSIEYGLFVESMMGFGFNAVTGDFSRGASGRLIENGKLTRAVSEVTLSANFTDLFARIDGLANDAPRDRAVQCPSMRVAEMTLAGS